jgi:hypothetical protein
VVLHQPSFVLRGDSLGAEGDQVVHGHILIMFPGVRHRFGMLSPFFYRVAGAGFSGKFWTFNQTLQPDDV